MEKLVDILFNRLKQYEDLGLEPDEIRKILNDKERSDKSIAYLRGIIRCKDHAIDVLNKEYDKLKGDSKQYEDLGLDPDEIRQILKDGEEIADACIQYKNRVAAFEESLKYWGSISDEAY